MKQIFKKISWLSIARIAFVTSITLAPFAVGHASVLKSPDCSFDNHFIQTAHAVGIQGVNCEKDTTLTELIVKVINWVLAVTLAIDVLFLIIGGFWYITSAGNEERATKGRNTVVNAIIGLVIIVLSFVIANVIAKFFSQSGNT